MNYVGRRYIWGWLNSVFNRFDPSRVKDVGPDRACAEWLLRCGAGLKWKNSKSYLTDYNSLPSTYVQKIAEINATDSAVMDCGFPHLNGLTEVEKIVFHKCGYLTDDALKYLPILKNSLRHLQISSCGNITAQGLQPVKELSKLQSILLYDLPEIKSKESVIQDLQSALPQCDVQFPYAQAAEQIELENEEKKTGKMK
ncbi:ATP synthase subunit s, mitochondrial [Neocloeon triangulifer]|uniref:ATP synthase subunit s, mitochondrial n=1 Tax=Neocloeon triangulifer TaxID=2078957 RepID=UPI00286F2D01|nr:ATP synthase subunit s, mitochondrial [Neocloeon triangulifer]